MTKRKTPKPERGDMDELSSEEKRYFDSKGAEPPPAEDESGAAGDAPDGKPAAEPEAKSAGLLETEPKPEGEGAAAEETPEAQKETRRVPLAELLSERERRRTAETELARDRARLATLETHLAVLAEGDGGLPDKAQDPEGYAKSLAAWAERHRTLLTRMRANAAQRLEETQAHARLLMAYQAQVEEFSKRQPDFRDAYAFLARDRDQELFALGYTDPVMREQVLRGEEELIVSKAMKDGVNAAERIYAAARRRGYDPGGPAHDRLRRAGMGQASAKSLGSASGGAPRPHSPEALAAMTEDEFAEATKGARWKRLWE